MEGRGQDGRGRMRSMRKKEGSGEIGYGRQRPLPYSCLGRSQERGLLGDQRLLFDYLASVIAVLPFGSSLSCASRNF